MDGGELAVGQPVGRAGFSTDVCQKLTQVCIFGQGRWPMNWPNALCDFDHVARACVRAGGFTGCHLDDGKASERPGDPARRHSARDLQDAPVASDKENIDGKPHRKRVDEVGGRNHERLAGDQSFAAEKPALPVGRAEGGLNLRGDGQARAAVSERARLSGAPKQRLKKVGPAHRRRRKSPGEETFAIQ